MQGIFLTRHCQVEVISTLKENPKEEQQVFSWFLSFFTRLMFFFQISILIFFQNITDICYVDKNSALLKNDLDEYEIKCEFFF